MLAVGNIYLIQRSNRLEVKKWKEIYYAYSNHKKVEMTMLISDKIALRFFTKHRGIFSNDMTINPSGSYNNYEHVCTYGFSSGHVWIWELDYKESWAPKTEKAVAPHSSTLAWNIPRMEEPGRLQSMESLRVGHDWATSLSLFTFMHWRRKWQPTPVFLPGEFQGWRSLVGCRLWGHTESDTTEVT